MLVRSWFSLGEVGLAWQLLKGIRHNLLRDLCSDELVSLLQPSTLEDSGGLGANLLPSFANSVGGRLLLPLNGSALEHSR